MKAGVMEHNESNRKEGNTTMNIYFENMMPYKIAYIRRTGPYGIENKITMEHLKAWAKENNLLDEKAVVLGIALDNPRTTDPDNCRYDTCLILFDNIETDDKQICFRNIDGGKYCVLEIEHTAEAVQKAWQELFVEMEKLKYEMDYSRPIIERYAVKKINQNKCEICVPIQ